MRTLEESAVIVGRIHGTAFFFSNDESSSFLDHMEYRLKGLFDSYFAGFLDGQSGTYKQQYKYIEEQKKEIADGNT